MSVMREKEIFLIRWANKLQKKISIKNANKPNYITYVKTHISSNGNKKMFVWNTRISNWINLESSLKTPFNVHLISKAHIRVVVALRLIFLLNFLIELTPLKRSINCTEKFNWVVCLKKFCFFAKGFQIGFYCLIDCLEA